MKPASSDRPEARAWRADLRAGDGEASRAVYRGAGGERLELRLEQDIILDIAAGEAWPSDIGDFARQRRPDVFIVLDRGRGRCLLRFRELAHAVEFRLRHSDVCRAVPTFIQDQIEWGC